MAQGEWLELGGKWYYFNGDGVMQTGWLQLSGKWYYLNSSGVMLTGWQKIDNVWYIFNGSGVMQTGWYYSNWKGTNVWTYQASSGAYSTGYGMILSTTGSSISGGAITCSDADIAEGNSSYNTLSALEKREHASELSFINNGAHLILNGFKNFNYTQAYNALNHYLGKSGTTRTLNIGTLIDVDGYGFAYQSSGMISLKNHHYSKGLSNTIYRHKSAFSNSAIVGTDWYIALGAFYTYYDMKILGSNKVTLTCNMRDYYDFDSKNTTAFANGVTYQDMWKLHIAGMARSYLNKGSISVTK